MRSPFRSEARAFWFVGLTAVAVAAIAAADVFASTTVVVTVSVLVILGVGGVYLRAPRPGRIPTAPAHAGSPAERRALLLVDELPSEETLSNLGEQADHVLVVALASTSRLRHWLNDVDPARKQAGQLMDDAVSRLRALQIDATGVVGDDDPLAAVDDALRTFGGDQLVVATSNDELVSRLRDRYAIPVTAAESTPSRS